MDENKFSNMTSTMSKAIDIPLFDLTNRRDKDDQPLNHIPCKNKKRKINFRILFHERPPEEKSNILRFIDSQLDDEDFDFLKLARNSSDCEHSTNLVNNILAESSLNSRRKLTIVKSEEVHLFSPAIELVGNLCFSESEHSSMFPQIIYKDPELNDVIYHNLGCARCLGYKPSGDILRQIRERRIKQKRRNDVMINHQVIINDLDNCNRKRSSYNGQKESRLYLLAVHKSFIHGLGLFTREPISEGHVITEYVGELIRSEVANRRERRGESITFLFNFNDPKGIMLDPKNKGSISRFINHSCDPNCFMRFFREKNGQKILILISKCNIQAGEELTLNYKPKNRNNKAYFNKCLCASANCCEKFFL